MNASNQDNINHLTTTYFLYCALGKSNYVKEACYSIASLIATNQCIGEQAKIAFMVSDLSFVHPVIANNKNVEVLVISNNVFASWVGEMNIVTRIKIKAIHFLFQLHPGADIIFIDTDTAVLEDLSSLITYVNQKGFLLHSRCQDIAKSIQMVDATQSVDLAESTQHRIQTFKKFDAINSMSGYGKKYIKPKHFLYYNSGVIGIPHQYQYLLNDVLKLNDLLAQEFKYCAVEEMAFSWIFELYGSVKTCEEQIFHYVKNKKFRHIVGYMFHILYEDDKNELTLFLQENDMPCLECYHLVLKDLPSFHYYIFSKKKAAYEELGLISPLDLTTYVDSQSQYYQSISSLGKIKNYIKKEKMFYQKTGSPM